MKIYISTAWENREAAKRFDAELERRCRNVTSFPWWEPSLIGRSESPPGTPDGCRMGNPEAVSVAMADLEAVSIADVFVLIGCPQTSSGRLAELATWVHTHKVHELVLVAPIHPWEEAVVRHHFVARPKLCRDISTALDLTEILATKHRAGAL